MDGVLIWWTVRKSNRYMFFQNQYLEVNKDITILLVFLEQIDFYLSVCVYGEYVSSFINNVVHVLVLNGYVSSSF